MTQRQTTVGVIGVCDVTVVKYERTSAMKRLTTVQLKHLDQHVYKREGASLLEPYFQVFWVWLAKHIPLWIAPSSITFLGLSLNILVTTLAMSYDHNITGEGPNWIYLLCAINLLVYQTLDALDGKHCIPTDTDDALPEFIDHGADALSNLLLTMCVGSAMGLNKLPTIALLIVAAQLALFYCYHWQCYISGTVSFKSFDVTEAQFSLMGLLMITYIFGADMWDIKIMESLELRQLIFGLVLLMSISSLCDTLRILFSRGLARNGTTLGGTHMLSPSVPYIMVLINWVAYCYWSNINQTHLSLYLMVFAIPLVKLNVNLVIACCTNSGLTFDIAVVVPFIATINASTGFLIPELLLLPLLMVFLWIDLFLTSAYYCYDMACYLNRYMFILPPEVLSRLKVS